MMMTQEMPVEQVTVLAYANPLEHLRDELRWLDRVIEVEVLKLRSRTQPFQQLAVNRQVFISHEEVDWLLRGAVEGDWDELAGLYAQVIEIRQEIQARVAASVAAGVFLPLVQLARLFGLALGEEQAVVICLAPELDRKYDRLYAYLQDDMTRKKPSVDLVLTLLCSTSEQGTSEDALLRWQVRSLFGEMGILLRAGILQVVVDGQSPSGVSDLARFLRVDGRIVEYLLGQERLDGRLVDWVKLERPEEGLDTVLVAAAAKAQLGQLVERQFGDAQGERRRVVIHLQGTAGVGKRSLALGACGELDCVLLCCDCRALLAAGTAAPDLLQVLLREGLLWQGALYFEHWDCLVGDEGQPIVRSLVGLMADYGWLVFLAGEKDWRGQDWFEGMVFQAIAVPLPEVGLRRQIWQQVLADEAEMVDEGWVEQLASQFRLTPGQVRSAVAGLRSRRGVEDWELGGLFEACRGVAQHGLGELAVKVEPRYGWGDLILPEDKLRQLREICSQSRYRDRVFGEWGFARKLSHGRGLSALFAGPPGTGKTMAAQVIARDLGVDLYKVDLSGVVSKYIGETEKNLSRIFREAESSNAILFFDEADALFGKRTEVADAHDRYANIETSYLLQRMEDYEGVVMLATNLRDNLDDAFLRRLRFVVEFPFPDEGCRELILRSHFPVGAPLCEGIDYGLLARRWSVAGGNIKNIVLNAAFYAAEAGDEIGMEHLVQGARREFEKMGKLWSELDLTSNVNR